MIRFSRSCHLSAILCLASILAFTNTCAGESNPQHTDSISSHVRKTATLDKNKIHGSNTHEQPMPMHQRFLLERERDRQWHESHSPSLDAILQPNDNDDRDRDLSNSKHDKKRYYNPVKEFARQLDVLSASWWVRLPEGERKPETRRAHSAAVYALSRSDGDGDKNSGNTEVTAANTNANANTNPIDPGPDGPDVEGNAQAMETENQNKNGTVGSNQETAAGPGGDIDKGNINAAASNATATNATATSITPTTNSTISDNSNNTNRVLATSLSQEYMIITGGFTDRDWKTFPIWAYDMTSATTSDNGRWFELTPPDILSDAEICSDNVTQVGMDHSMTCSPASRVGHISLVREGVLYVFGGLEYNEHDGVFFMEKEPFMYQMELAEIEFDGRDYENYEGNYDADKATGQSMSWKRWLPKVTVPPAETKSSQSEEFSFTVNRGEVRGGYWESGDKLIIYGGLHVREYATSTGREQQADTTLGDVWAYDFKTDTWEIMASTWGPDGIVAMDHPGERTSHAATVVGDELVIYGGLREIETYLWDGSTVWSQLDDIWIFNLKSLKWAMRPMAESNGRAYHSVVGWETPDHGGTILTSFGGYKMMMDPVDNQQISYVYDDVMVSMPQVQNISQPSVWYVAAYNGLQPETISLRLEHSAVLSKEFGNMFVWGGRYRQTTDISGVWSLNIAGKTSTVEYEVRSEDAEMANAGAAYVILLTVMMMSMMFTYACGVVQRRAEGEGFNMDAVNADPTMGGSVFGRNGLNQDIIDTLPLKKYQHENSGETEEHGGGEGTQDANRQGTAEGAEGSSSMNFGVDDEEQCCAICLVEYEVGEDIRCLPCNHEFHKGCVDAWLGNNASCPACRYSLSDLTSLTTSAESFAQTIRATITASLRTGASEEQSQPRENTQATATASSLPRHPNSPPTAPDHAVAPGARGLANLRRMLAGRRRNLTRVQSNDSLSSRSREGGHISSDDNDSFGDLELSYNSSLELTESYESRTSNDSFDSGDVPIEGRPRRMRTASTERRRRRNRGRGGRMRRVRGLNGTLDAPLQPSDASLV